MNRSRSGMALTNILGILDGQRITSDTYSLNQGMTCKATLGGVVFYFALKNREIIAEQVGAAGFEEEFLDLVTPAEMVLTDKTDFVDLQRGTQDVFLVRLGDIDISSLS